MSNPYDIEGPAVISFSGGRTSAYMLWEVLLAGLHPDVHVLFANTGKERPETLDFVHDCETIWGVKVHWLEYVGYWEGIENPAERYREVDYPTASRDGEPFSNLLRHRARLPNPLIRFCTTELKIRPMKHWMMAHGYSHWDMVVGLRADEPRRVSKQRGRNTKERWEVLLPLADAHATLQTVEDFWELQPFKLRLDPHEGNCDLCFLKSAAKKQRIAQDSPQLVRWWADKEAAAGQPFRLNHPTYAQLLESNPVPEEEDSIDCSCTD